jgi:hypothetical protein
LVRRRRGLHRDQRGQPQPRRGPVVGTDFGGALPGTEELRDRALVVQRQAPEQVLVVAFDAVISPRAGAARIAPLG